MKQLINLTTGLEHLTDIKTTLSFDGFTRLQSSHLEQKDLEKFLNNVDNNILMWLALGEEVWIFDTTSRKTKNNVSRVCWQGIPWVKYCLYKTWFGIETEYKYGMHSYFQTKYKELKKHTKRRLKYYRKFLLTDTVNLKYVCHESEHDGDDEFYLNCVKENVYVQRKI